MTYPTVQETVDQMRYEIKAMMVAGDIPQTVSSFAELHDYCDANMLAEDLFPERSEDDDAYNEKRLDRITDILNPAQNQIDQWLKSR